MPKGIYKHKPHSEKTKKKISIKLVGKQNRKGHKNSPEHNLKISQANKKRKHNPWEGFQKGHPSYLKYHTEETKRKLSLMKRGKKNYNWKGGISRPKHKGDWRYLKWRKAIFQRDNFTCQKCGQYGEELIAHHIKSWNKYLKLRYNVNNGITLCINCHRLTDNYGYKKSNNK